MGCRLNCRYCPQNELLKQYKKTENSQKMRMTLEDFCKILPQIYEESGTGAASAGGRLYIGAGTV